MRKEASYLEGIKEKIRSGNLEGAEKDLHLLIVNRDFDAVWGCKSLPAVWSFVSRIHLGKTICGTAQINLVSGELRVDPQFILDKVNSLSDLLFIVLHERDHRLLRRIYRIDWSRLRKILNFKLEWVSKVQNVVEDAWINGSVRAEVGINSTLPETFYCWSEEDAKNPGMPSEENPEGSGFDPHQHVVGEPKSEQYALLTCLSEFAPDGIQSTHECLYTGADHIFQKFKRSAPSRHYGVMSFPSWYDHFCDWLEIHKDDLTLPAPGCEGDPDCPVHGSGDGAGNSETDNEDSENESSENGSGSGNSGGSGASDEEDSSNGAGGSEGEDAEANQAPGSGDGDSDSNSNENNSSGQHQHGQGPKCTCRGGEGLLNEPMTVAEALARMPVIVVSHDETEEHSDGLKVDENAQPIEKGPKPEDMEPVEIFEGGGKRAGWGSSIRRIEVVPKTINDLEELDRELLEMGGSVLTDRFRTSSVAIKGAVKQNADKLIQNIATMRVTEHKIIRPDPNMPTKPSRRDLMNMGMGSTPVMWDHPQYLEQHELRVYMDVSGSMCNWYRVALYLQKQLEEFGCDIYHFSTVVVKPVPGRDDNAFWTTGGTHFDAVAEHIVRDGVKACIVVTDNCDSISDNWTAAMREIPELYALFLMDGHRPPDYKAENYFNPNNYRGYNGWHTVTEVEKIISIWASDVNE